MTASRTSAPGLSARHPLHRRTAALLEAHVPLSLLLDLADPAGPHSRRVLAEERADLAWIPRQQDRRAG